MDLKQFEETFSAYQRKESDTGSLVGTLPRRRSVLDRPKELSVIEGKRAQNCSIVLSTMKMTNTEVCWSIYSCRNRGQGGMTPHQHLGECRVVYIHVELYMQESAVESREGVRRVEVYTYGRADSKIVQ